jgi:hypothetical protein
MGGRGSGGVRRSAGRPHLSADVHKLRGTYRRDRHGPKKPEIKVGANLGLRDLFDLQCGPGLELTREAWQRLLEIWARVKDEFLPRPDRLAGATHEDPYRFRPGGRPWAWWAERDLQRPGLDGEELLELKKLGALVEGEWEAARAQLRKRALNHWASIDERNALGTAEWLGVPLAWVQEWFGSTKKSRKGALQSLGVQAKASPSCC